MSSPFDSKSDDQNTGFHVCRVNSFHTCLQEQSSRVSFASTQPSVQSKLEEMKAAGCCLLASCTQDDESSRDEVEQVVVNRVINLSVIVCFVVYLLFVLG